jgi:CheY-like chemotaxis protein
MPPPRRFLIVEDQSAWRITFGMHLRVLVPDAQVDEAAGHDEAVRRIATSVYDVVIVDLVLPRTAGDEEDPARLGKEIARRVRADPGNRDAGLLIATGFPTSARTRDAFRDCAADDFVDKLGYTAESFLASVRFALRAAALRRARDHAAREVRLEIQATATEITGARVAGRTRARYPNRVPLPLAADDWTAKGDALNRVLLAGDPAGWRARAREVGLSLFAHLTGAPELSAALAAARAAGDTAGELCLRLCGPAAVLGVPFELMQDDGAEYLAFRHAMIRSVTAGAGTVSRQTIPFDRMVEEAVAEGTPVRALVVGANVDGAIPAVEEEARRVRVQFETELGRLGVGCEVTELVGADATVANVTEVLAARETHLFHYAGHGRFNASFPEMSGLVLRGSDVMAPLRATDLYLLCKDSRLQLVFLSCCLGARSAVEAGRGEFAGVFDALARADVSAVLGYRWVVTDDSALAMAASFYGWLFRTLSPSRALFQARADIAMGGAGWNDETWLSPILLVQNP